METLTVKIGADELILWLRKNNIARNVPNDQINGLGVQIYRLLVDELHGVKTEENVTSLWNCNDENTIGQYLLPQTSAQYEIAIEKLPDLYRALISF